MLVLYAYYLCFNFISIHLYIIVTLCNFGKNDEIKTIYSNISIFSLLFNLFYSRIISIDPVWGHAPPEQFEGLDLMRSFLVHSWSEVA